MSTSLPGVKGGVHSPVSTWHVVCDPIWQMTLRISEMGYPILWNVLSFNLSILLVHWPVSNNRKWHYLQLTWIVCYSL